MCGEGSSEHIEIARDYGRSCGYCKKTNTRQPGVAFIEYGTGQPGRGTRTDIGDLHRAIIGGARLRELADQYASFVIRYPRGFDKLREIYQPRRDGSHDVDVIVLYGPAGSGKSHYVFNKYPEAYWLSAQSSGVQWWDGYDGHSVVVIDEFEGDMPFKILKRILDKFPYRVQIKGSMPHLQTYKYIIMSNSHPENWYKWLHDDGTERLHKPALQRRITQLFACRKVGNTYVRVREEWND